MNNPDKVIVLDRDGVINYDSDDYIRTVDECIPIPGSIEAIAKLYKAGYHVFIATNQSGIGRSYYDIATLTGMHNKLRSLVEKQGGKITGIVYCPHLPTDNCDCRKPKTGLLSQLEKKYHVKLSGHPFIGDSLKDLECAQKFGCQGVLVKTGKGEKTEKENSEVVKRAAVFNDLAHYVNQLIST